MKRDNISTGGKWEPIIGYSRAVRVGAFVHISGCTAMTAQGIVGKDDPAAQTIQILKVIEAALEKAGAKLEHIVRTRMYLTDISHWEQVGRAHGSVFGAILPASTLVEVSRLIDPDMLVEIEAEAIITD